jgi:hypothetical protein
MWARHFFAPSGVPQIPVIPPHAHGVEYADDVDPPRSDRPPGVVAGRSTSLTSCGDVRVCGCVGVGGSVSVGTCGFGNTLPLNGVVWSALLVYTTE